jgi:hypothetical protein
VRLNHRATLVPGQFSRFTLAIESRRACFVSMAWPVVDFADDDRWRGVRIRYDWAGQKREMESLVGNRHSRREWWEI